MNGLENTLAWLDEVSPSFQSFTPSPMQTEWQHGNKPIKSSTYLEKVATNLATTK
jgi:hypothetical protein